jgi:hypothetical protein
VLDENRAAGRHNQQLQQGWHVRGELKEMRAPGQDVQHEQACALELLAGLPTRVEGGQCQGVLPRALEVGR